MTEDVDTSSKLTCPFGQSRLCGPDCMAYTLLTPEGDDYTNSDWAHCLILVSGHRLAKHSVIIASQLDAIRQQLKSSAADQKRAAQNPKVPT